MHLIVDQVLSQEQLSSPKRYIYELCEMFGWDEPHIIDSDNTSYKVVFPEKNYGKSKIRRRLVIDGCRRLGTMPQSFLLSDNYSIVTIPKYIK